MNWRAVSVGVLAILLAGTLCACSSEDPDAVVDPASIEETSPTVEPVPDLVNMKASDAIAAAEASGRTSYLFGAGIHAYTPGAAPGTAGMFVTAYEVADTDVYIRIGSDETTMSIEDPSPWWYEGHSSKVRLEGLGTCFGCHGESYCEECHVQHDVDISGIQRLAVREELPYEVFRPLAVLGSPFVLRGTAWSYEDEPTFTLEGPKDEEAALEAMLLTLPKVFADQAVTPRVFYDFVERRETESFLTVEISKETAEGVDWETVTADDLPSVVDSYVLK